MKRFILCTVFLLFTLVGCAAEPSVAAPVTQGFGCKAQIAIQSTTYEAQLQIPNNGLFTATLLSPDSVQGTVLCWNGEDVTATLHGVTMQIPANALPGGNAIGAVRRVLQTVERGAQSTVGDTLSGTADDVAFTLTLRADGFPLTLTLPEYQTTVTFSDFSYTYTE